MRYQLIAQGAEARIQKEGNLVIKNRIPKSYRLPVLDTKLRKQRTRKEAKLLQKAVHLIPIPNVKRFSDEYMHIEMDFIPGKKLSESLDSLKNKPKVCQTIGEQIAKLHDAGIIHGDLTTSNIILSTDKKLYFIDFGLGYESNNIEDKAVDLHLIKEAFEAKHFTHSKEFFLSVMKGYSKSKNSKAVLKRLEKVEKRGRYKQAY